MVSAYTASIPTAGVPCHPFGSLVANRHFALPSGASLGGTSSYLEVVGDITRRHFECLQVVHATSRRHFECLQVVHATTRRHFECLQAVGDTVSRQSECLETVFDTAPNHSKCFFEARPSSYGALGVLSGG